MSVLHNTVTTNRFCLEFDAVAMLVNFLSVGVYGSLSALLIAAALFNAYFRVSRPLEVAPI